MNNSDWQLIGAIILFAGAAYSLLKGVSDGAEFGKQCAMEDMGYVQTPDGTWQKQENQDEG